MFEPTDKPEAYDLNPGPGGWVMAHACKWCDLVTLGNDHAACPDCSQPRSTYPTTLRVYVLDAVKVLAVGGKVGVLPDDYLPDVV